MTNFLIFQDHYAMTISINLTLGEKFIGLFYDIFRGCSDKEYTSLVLTLSWPVYVKLRWKNNDLSPKSFFQTWKQPFAVYFLLAKCHVCPVAIPEIFLHLLIEPRIHPTPVPRFDLWVGQSVKSSISFGVSKMPARDKIRSTSVSGSPQVNWNVFFTTTQGNDLRCATSVFSIAIPKSPTSERFKWTANLFVSM